jgi:hypothetical protein
MQQLQIVGLHLPMWKPQQLSIQNHPRGMFGQTKGATRAFASVKWKNCRAYTARPRSWASSWYRKWKMKHQWQMSRSYATTLYSIAWHCSNLIIDQRHQCRACFADIVAQLATSRIWASPSYLAWGHTYEVDGILSSGKQIHWLGFHPNYCNDLLTPMHFHH